ncbi:MAG: PH domain-containing protein [bacterium]|nr:PH domain-containing protein [bacterium]
MASQTYDFVKQFKQKYPLTVAWRLNKHCKIVDTHLNPDECIRYAFCAQKNNSIFDIISSNVVVLTNKRLIIASKRVLWGYFYLSITPDLFNDLSIYQGLIWGRVKIDTVKELVILSNVDPNALQEIETQISTFMIKEKRKYSNQC